MHCAADVIRAPRKEKIAREHCFGQRPGWRRSQIRLLSRSRNGRYVWAAKALRPVASLLGEETNNALTHELFAVVEGSAA